MSKVYKLSFLVFVIGILFTSCSFTGSRQINTKCNPVSLLNCPPYEFAPEGDELTEDERRKIFSIQLESDLYESETVFVEKLGEILPDDSHYKEGLTSETDAKIEPIPDFIFLAAKYLWTDNSFTVEFSTDISIVANVKEPNGKQKPIRSLVTSEGVLFSFLAQKKGEYTVTAQAKRQGRFKPIYYTLPPIKITVTRDFNEYPLTSKEMWDDSDITSSKFKLNIEKNLGDDQVYFDGEYGHLGWGAQRYNEHIPTSKQLYGFSYAEVKFYFELPQNIKDTRLVTMTVEKYYTCIPNNFGQCPEGLGDHKREDVLAYGVNPVQDVEFAFSIKNATRKDPKNRYSRALFGIKKIEFLGPDNKHWYRITPPEGKKHLYSHYVCTRGKTSSAPKCSPNDPWDV